MVGGRWREYEKVECLGWRERGEAGEKWWKGVVREEACLVQGE